MPMKNVYWNHLDTLGNYGEKMLKIGITFRITNADSYEEAQEGVPNNDRDILYYIQVGAFSEKRAAINLKDSLDLIG